MAALAASLGDPAGIGPELLCEAWTRRSDASLPPFFVAGGAAILAEAAATRRIEVPIRPISDPADAEAAFRDGLPVLGEDDGVYCPGEPSADGARLALASLSRAAALALDGSASGIVTGPVSKAQLSEVGFGFPGQTEFVADVCAVVAQNAVMLLAGPQLKTVPLTVHCALAEVPGLISAELIQARCRIVAAGLRRDFGIESPRIAVAALNPHAGEGGKFGNEEAEIIAPAIAALRQEGIEVTGPHPADALFAPHARGGYDVAVCMYHDQALVPLKALDFDAGVNMTLGLPIVRTSPDHGTAFAIAGKRLADPGAMIAAICMAGEAAARRDKR